VREVLINASVALAISSLKIAAVRSIAILTPIRVETTCRRRLDRVCQEGTDQSAEESAILSHLRKKSLSAEAIDHGAII
jgi:hypothetical protein